MTPPKYNEEVLFYSPFAGIWKHSLAEFTLMKLVSKRYKVSVIRCEKTFNEFCTVMNSKGLNISSAESDKQSICKRCLKNASVLQNDNFQVLSYQSTSIDSDYREILEKIENSDAEELIKVNFMDIPVGRISAFETIIKFKKTNLELTGAEMVHLRTKVTHAVRSTLIAHETLAFMRPKCVIVFSPQYAVGAAFSEYCARLGIKVYGVNFSFNSSENTKSVLVWNWSRYGLASPAIEAWDREDRKVTRDQLARAKRHLKTLTSSKSPFVYSTQASGNSSREFFGIPNRKKILLMAMSSYDEVFANFTSGLTKYSPLDGKVFSDQIDWVFSTIDYVKTLDDVVLIIRPHPREIANKRDSVNAEHAGKLALALQNLPNNVYVDWPRFGFSIYDHFSEIHALITGWSSVGIEAMLSGIPCVSYDSRLVDFPKDIHFTGDDKDKYFSNISKALENYDSKTIKSNALNWYAFAFSRGSIRLSGLLHDQFIFRNFQITRRFADTLENRLPRFAKWCETRMGNNLRDESKLLNLIHLSSDNLFEGADRDD
jgi:hypothetical protein